MGWEVAGLEGDKGGTTFPVPSTCHDHSSATSSPRPWHPTHHPPRAPSMLRHRNLGCWEGHVPIPPCLPSSSSKVGGTGVVPGSGVVSSEPRENHWAVAGCRHLASTETMQRMRRSRGRLLDPILLPRGPAAQDGGPWLIALACAVWSRGPGTAPTVIGGPDTPLARPAPAPHGPHPAGAEHPRSQATVCPASPGRGGQWEPQEGSQGQKEMSEWMRGRAGEESLPGNGE